MTSRRRFLQTAGAALGSTFVAKNAHAEKKSDLVSLRPEIEPLVKLIERTPRSRCIEVVAEKVKQGLPYRHFLAALFMAGIRNVNPQPPGFKFHCVFVIHAAHQISLDVPAKDRLLPLFWALDNFKVSQQQDVKQGDFELQPVRGKLPAPAVAWREFKEAMDDWDEAKADRAIAVLARTEGAQAIAERMWEYGARDYRNIGHKAIFVANTWQTLQTIGWQHAEPALRSLVLGLLDFGKGKRVNNYAFEDQCYRPNVELAQRHAAKLPANWAQQTGFTQQHRQATATLLNLIGAGKVRESCQLAANLVAGKRGIPAQAIWDAVHLVAGQLMMQQPGIYGIHTVTSAHGLRYAFDVASRAETRLLMMLQAVGWMAQFRSFMATRNNGLNSANILKLANTKPTGGGIHEVLETLTSQPTTAASQAFSWAKASPTSDALSRAAKQLVAHKATDAHHLKYSTSILADAEKVSPQYRPHMYATATYFLCGSKMNDSSAVKRTKAAFSG